MRGIYIILLLGFLGTCRGQNFGASAGVDVVWVDDLSQDDFGTSFIVTGGHVHPDESMYSDIQTTTPAPVRGSGATHGTDTEGEADLLANDSLHRVFPGHFFKLSCNMTNDDNTSFTLDWYKNDTKLESNDHLKIISANSSLVISSPKKEDAGFYRCQTRSGIPKDNPVVKNFTVIYFEIRKMPKSLIITNQEQLSLECPVDGRPYPKVVWRKDSALVTELKVNDTRYSLAPNDNEVPDTKLIISKVDSSDRGNYTCNVTTHTGSFEVFTFVRVKDIYAALWPFLGIVVEVLLLGIIIFIFEKRRAKAEFEESDTDQGNDQ
ncbi:neuroplastin-like isoform X1 [Eriocheir sinensis]|nr:neuroplastin-like isoform X1 [Eriocheir sinensis]